MVLASIAITVAIDHRFDERMRRHVKGVEALMIDSSLLCGLRMAPGARDVW